MSALEFCLIFVNVLSVINSVSFVFPDGELPRYTGFIWKGASKVHLSPHLQATPNDGLSQSGELCAIRVYSVGGGPSIFITQITDKANGFADVLVEQRYQNSIQTTSTFVQELEALDCDNPAHVSERVPLTIHVINQEGPIFDQPSYTFTVSQQTLQGTVIGTVQAIPQLKEDEDALSSAICNYQLQPLEVPFSIDRYGVIRVQGKLKGGQPYLFRVGAEDCRRPIPRKSTVDVMVRQIAEGCQPGWKGVPAFLEYSGGLYTPGNLLYLHKLKLETCAGNCPEATIEARMELKSSLRGYKLITASTEACLHDPEHLSLQRSLCDIYPATFTNLLPDPDKDIVAQLNGPPLGNPPRLVAPSRQWRFETQAKSVWEINPKHLQNDTQQNAFDSDFTITFWLVRHPGVRYFEGTTVEDREETVLCSQDQEEANWRFLSISFRECRLIVRLVASFQYPMETDDSQPQKATVWMFGPLPEEYCRPANLNQVTWHHYAITFSRSPWGNTEELVSLLVDGQNLGTLSVPIETVVPTDPPYIPSEKKAKPRITVGACYDPNTRLTRQHLNGELAGLTVLLGKAESPNNLRCIAQCGESLLVPNVMKYLREDITVNLTNSAITVYGQVAEHVADILRAIAYIRTQPQVSPDYTATVAQTRNLTLSTKYSCSPNEPVTIPSSNIQLYIPKMSPPSFHAVQLAQPILTGSQWVAPGVASAQPPDKTKQQGEEVVVSNGQSTPPPSLLVQGSDIIITELPINSFGIPIFSDITFVLPEEVAAQSGRNDGRNAAGVLLDNCHVWIASSGDLSEKATGSKSMGFDDEHIEWSLDKIMAMGLAGKNDRHGVQLSGRKPAGDYEKVLHSLHYVPPKFVGTETNKTQDESGTEYVATIGLICSMEYGQQTSQFYVKVIVESPENAQAHLSNSEEIERLSPDRQDDGIPHQAQSDQEKRIPNDPLRPLKSADPELAVRQANRPAGAGPFMITGIVIAAILVITLICLVVVALVRMQRTPRRQPPPDRRRRFATQPADFGGANLKHDPTLRLTANPVGEMEYTGLGTVSENLYGSYGNLVPNRCIFSPPTHQKCDSSGSGPRLADLDEFDEDYLDQVDEQFYDDEEEEDGHRTTSDRSTPNEATYHSTVTINGGQVYRAEEYGVDVHEWMDDEPETTPVWPGRAVSKMGEVWDSVSQKQPSEHGSQPVHV